MTIAKLILTLAAAGFAGSLYAAPDKITIATDATFPPFESIDANGKLVGYDVDLMYAICKAAAMNCNVISAPRDGMIHGLMSNKYDALISQLTVTDARRRVMTFSDIYDRPVFRFVAKRHFHRYQS